MPENWSHDTPGSLGKYPEKRLIFKMKWRKMDRISAPLGGKEP